MASWVSDVDFPGRQVVCYHGTCACNRIGIDLSTREHGRIRPDTTALFDRRSGKMFLPLFGSAHEVVICERDFRSDKAVVRDVGEGADEGARLDFASVPDDDFIFDGDASTDDVFSSDLMT